MIPKPKQPPKPKPACIVEGNLQEGDDECSFTLRGSAAWLEKMTPFLSYNFGLLTGNLWERLDTHERAELIAGINALRAHQSFHGKLINITIAQEKTQ